MYPPHPFHIPQDTPTERKIHSPKYNIWQIKTSLHNTFFVKLNRAGETTESYWTLDRFRCLQEEQKDEENRVYKMNMAKQRKLQEQNAQDAQRSIEAQVSILRPPIPQTSIQLAPATEAQQEEFMNLLAETPDIDPFGTFETQIDKVKQSDARFKAVASIKDRKALFVKYIQAKAAYVKLDALRNANDTRQGNQNALYINSTPRLIIVIAFIELIDASTESRWDQFYRANARKGPFAAWKISLVEKKKLFEDTIKNRKKAGGKT